LPQLANLLVGTFSSLQQDDVFREALTSVCDLLVVEEAERLTEAELLKLASLARRLVLVGQAGAEGKEPRSAEKNARTLSGLHPLAPACFSRLWQALGGDAGRVPYSWYRAEGRLICQLVPVRPEDRQNLESEGLADAAEVELRILNTPKARPCLAEVAFPATFSLQQAFALIVRELGEVPLPPAGRTTWWQQNSESCSWCAGPAASPIHEYVELEAGLHVGLSGDTLGHSWCAARVEFSHAAGWDRNRAEGWVADHLLRRDAGRTVFLQVPYRHAQPLAQTISEILYPDDSLWPLLTTAPAREPALEFVAVPPLRKTELPREGAGLELDLTSSRHADRLPPELRPGLPATGFANFLEAQALVRCLEQLAQTPGALPETGCNKSAVAVLALFEGQAQLLRRLISQSEILRCQSLVPEVGVAPAMRQREWDIVFLSLTRSHAHRSVPFSMDVADLALALTRARRKLCVFGDLGSLVKRTHWQGPLDHFPAPAAQLEWQRLSRFVHYLQGVLTPPKAIIPVNQNGC
jgi:hypothetical protein